LPSGEKANRTDKYEEYATFRVAFRVALSWPLATSQSCTLER
jgi:hypothetical protein